MRVEIKEILEYLNEFINDKEEITKYGCEISVKQAKNLLDYITTLQEENETLKQDYINVKNYIIMRNVNTEVEDKALVYNLELENINKKRYKDYKSRIDKAIEYGKNCLENIKDQDQYMCESIDIVSLLQMIHQNYLDILQGDDNK